MTVLQYARTETRYDCQFGIIAEGLERSIIEIIFREKKHENQNSGRKTGKRLSHLPCNRLSKARAMSDMR